MRLESKKARQQVAILSEGRVWYYDELGYDNKGVSQTTNVSQPVKEIVRLSIGDGQIVKNVDLVAVELVTTIGFLNEIVCPGTDLRELRNDMEVFADGILAPLYKVCFILDFTHL